MLPIRDENPSQTRPYVMWAFLVANIVVFVWSYLLQSPEGYDAIVTKYGMTPALFLSGQATYTIITSMFLHGGFVHLLGNMLYLYIFGDNIEDACGHDRFLAFYLLSGVLASLADAYLTADPTIPSIGASEAISAVLGAYIVLYPRAKILTLVPFLGFFSLVKIPAFLYLGFWFLLQFISGSLELSAGVAYWAHIGGFVAGTALIFLFRKRGRHVVLGEYRASYESPLGQQEFQVGSSNGGLRVRP